MFISVNGTNIRNIVEYTNVYSTSASMNSLRVSAAGECDVQRFELPAPFASRIEGERYLLRIARRNGLCVISERRAPATAVVSGDGYGLRCPVFDPEPRARPPTPECMRPKRTVSVPPVSRIVSVTAIIRPFRPVSPVRACRVPHAAVVTASASNNNPRSIGTQMRPRPAFLMRPSAVSDSTILSSTPLMKVLLPGVE